MDKAMRQKNGPSWQTRLIKSLRRDWLLYAMLIPGLIYVLLFHYIPMTGITLAFRKYSVVSGAGDWVGLKVFEKLFAKKAFRQAFLNNLTISLEKLLFGFPVPVILPNFISWFIISGLCAVRLPITLPMATARMTPTALCPT